MIRRLSSAVFVLLASLSLWAQTNISLPEANQQPTAHVRGQPRHPRYAGEASAQNVLLFGLDSEVAYDDNVFDSNRLRRGDGSYAFGSHIALLQQRRHLSIDFDYQPSVQFYGRTRESAEFNHILGLDVGYQLGPRFALRLHDSFSERTGIFQPRTSQEFIPGLGSPRGFNEGVFTPLARERANTTLLDATYRKSSRTSLVLFGGFQKLNFGQDAVNRRRLFDATVTSGGLNYLYRLSPHSTLGLRYSVQNFDFRDERMITHSALLSLAVQLSPRIGLDVFTGPQYARVRSPLLPALPCPIGNLTRRSCTSKTQWHAAGGVSVTKRSEKTVFEVSAQRMLDDGGGLLTSVIGSSVGLGLRRRLKARWDAIWSLSATRTDALGFQFTGSRISSQEAEFGLEHSLTTNLATHLTYTFIHQRASGFVRSLADVDRNHVSLGLFYQLRRPLGR